MHTRVITFLVCTAVAALSVGTARPNDWTAVQVSGGVFALEDGSWIELGRGSLIADGQIIKSAPVGGITLRRGVETVELGPDTTVQIEHQAGLTTVYNHSGTVKIVAATRDASRLAVQTPDVKAVTKGGDFTVETSAEGSTIEPAGRAPLMFPQ